MAVHFILLRDRASADPGAKASKQHRWTKDHVQARSVKDLFENAEAYVSKLRPDERWNIYYSVFNSTADQLREFVSQDVLAFDFDGVDHSKADDYILAMSDVMGIPDDEFTVVNSGNGLHFIFQMTQEFKKEDIAPLQVHYKELLKIIGARFKAENLPTSKLDMILDTARILRVPFSENRKPDKGIKQCRPLQINFTPHDIDLRKLSGLPTVSEEEQLSVRDVKRRYSLTDNKGIFEQCQFMNWAKNSPQEVREPTGYAALSIAARMQDGRDVAKELIKSWTNSSSIAQWDADEKIDQALSNSGPRTCEGINKHYGKCSSCPLFGKVTSPITIQGPDFIRTEGTGFHDIVPTEKGERLIPNPHDLRRFLERKAPYKVVNKKLIYRWDGRQYARLSDMFLPHFAENHFNPHVTTSMIDEFTNVVTRYNCVEADWFAETSTGFVNFQNGALEWASGQLHEASAVRGFRYVLPFEYDPNAQAPRWERFLHDVFDGDLERATLIEEFIGYCLSNDPLWKQKALILLGAGSNGKSTLINVLHRLAGKGNFSVVKVDRFNEPTFVQQLDGKLFNISGETPRKGFEESAGIKELIGGDHVTARELYGTPYTFQNRAKIVFACNEIPRTVDNTHGFYRRFWIVEFNRTFTDAEADTGINEALAQELPGIFNRVYRAYTTARGRKAFTEPKSSQEALEALREEMDVVGSWIADHVTAAPGGFVANSEVYAAFFASMEATGNRGATFGWNSQRLAGRIRKMFPGIKKDKQHGERGHFGLKLTIGGSGHSSREVSKNERGSLIC